MTDGALTVDDFVAEYGAHVDAQSAAVFVGAGLSMLAGYPGWEQLVRPYVVELGVENLTDFPLLVQYFEDSRPDGPERVRQDIIDMVRSPGIVPSTAHRRLVSLPIADIWTTNYDQLIERAGQEVSIPIAVYEADDDLTQTRPAAKRLYKMHGSVGETEVSTHLVISRDDFDRYPTTHGRFWHLVRASFLTRSFLFLGFSLSDPNITDILRLARLYASAVPRPHYAVMAREGSDPHIARLRLPDLARVGIRVVEIEKHADVGTVLERLDARCRPPRAFVSGSAVEDTDIARWTERLSLELGALFAADTSIRLMSGGEVGSSVGYEMCRRRLAAGTYDSDDFVVIRRLGEEELSTAPNTRLGLVVFEGEEAELLRSAAFERVRAVMVLGGSHGTRDEMRQATSLGMGVIAIGGSGGAAAERWAADVANLPDVRLGERPVDPADLVRLGDSDPRVAAQAAARLLKQALFLV